ncbi:MAG: hypothetical protein ACTSP4_13585 [Candidatus Hodarchaeales archaeon]
MHLKNLDDDQPSHAIFICFFDERRGHVLLYTYPREFLRDETERKIIQIHSIWWMKPEEISNLNTHVHLELAGRVYAAMDFRVKTPRIKRRSGMTGKLADERFILMVRSPSVLSFLSDEILDLAYNRIISEIGDKLNNLVMNDLISIGEFSSVLPKDDIENRTRETLELLDNLCRELLPSKNAAALGNEARSRHLSFKEEKSLEILNKRLSKTSKPLRTFSISSKKKPGMVAREKPATRSKPARFDFVKYEIDNNQGKIAFTVVNRSEQDLKDLKITVTEATGFFERNKWDIELLSWKHGEKLVFKVPVGDLSQKDGSFILTVNAAGEQLYIKKLPFVDLS